MRNHRTMKPTFAFIFPLSGEHPDQGLPPGFAGYPSHGLPGSPGHPGNALPPGGIVAPPIVIPPGAIAPGTPTQPIYLPGSPDQGLPGYGGGYPSHGLPGAPAYPSHGLPGSPGHVSPPIVVYPPGLPDQGLPPTPGLPPLVPAHPIAGVPGRGQLPVDPGFGVGGGGGSTQPVPPGAGSGVLPAGSVLLIPVPTDVNKPAPLPPGIAIGSVPYIAWGGRGTLPVVCWLPPQPAPK